MPLPNLPQSDHVTPGLDHLRVTSTLCSSGELRPQPQTPPQLDDHVWVYQRLERSGERAIAQELGCARETVRAAIRRHEEAGHAMPNRRHGRRRILTVQPTLSPIDGLQPAERNLIDRLRADQQSAATEELLIQRIHNAHRAAAAQDTLGYEEAMFAISTVAARIAHHSRTLRIAA